jgi:hypothetical protein
MTNRRAGLALILSILASAILCWPAWPGFMSYDSLLAFRESLTGVWTAVTPPMHPYLLWLFGALHLGVGGLFYTQALILFFSAALICGSLLKRDTGFFLSFGLFVLAFPIFPTMIGTLSCLWKDVPTASFALLGVALWILSLRSGREMLFYAAAASYCVALSLRYNALPLLLPLFVLSIMGLQRLTRRQLLIRSAVLMCAIGLANATTLWRLPDLRQLPPEHVLQGTQLFDLIGVSACENSNFVPAAVSDGKLLTPAQIREVYDPRHVQLSFVKKPGIPQLHETDAGGQVERNWRDDIPTHIGCYLAHRTAVLREQMGVVEGEVFYPTHGGIDPNPYRIALTHPAAAAQLTSYVVASSTEDWRRPVVLYIAAVICAMLMWFFAPRLRLIICALFVSSCAYVLGLFFAAPTAEARYIFPSDVFCAVCIATTVGFLVTERRQRYALQEGDSPNRESSPIAASVLEG